MEIEDREDSYRQLKLNALEIAKGVMFFHPLDKLDDSVFADTMLEYILKFKPKGFLKKIVGEVQQPGLDMKFLRERYIEQRKDAGRNGAKILRETANNKRFHRFLEKYVLD